MPIRVVDAGEVSGLRSQAAYHGVARAFEPTTPNTIVVLTPGDAHVCIGFHQRVAGEVDLAYCRREGLPVVRREIGGGTVLLDRDQLFVQWIFHPSSLPRQIGQRFALFTAPMIAAFREFGIRAEYVPANDVQVDGRKISGTGAGAVCEAEIVVGNFLFDFDHERMARVLDFPDDTFRRNYREGLYRYMTTMRRELGKAPGRERVKSVYLKYCAEALGETLVSGEFSARELEAMEATESRFATREWLHREGGLERPGRKIHADVWVYQGTESTAPGNIRTTVRLRHDTIDAITFDCAFPVQESGALRRLESELRHVRLAHEPVAAAVDRSKIHLGPGGLDRGDVIRAVLGAGAPASSIVHP